MRIALVTGEYPPQAGGVGDYSQALARELAAAGADVHVLATQVAGAPREETVGGVQVQRAIPGWGWAGLARVRALVQALQPDVVNLQYQAAAYNLGAPIHFLPRVAGRPTVVTFHDLRVPYLFPKAGRLRPAAVTCLARGAAGVIVTDRADEAELRRRGGVARLARFPIGSNIAFVTPPGYDRLAWRARLGAGPGEALLGFFGFLNESKGGKVLVEALAQLAAQSRPVCLALIGEPTGASDPTNTSTAAAMERLIGQHGLAQRVTRTGFLPPEDVSAALQACDLLVLPYLDGASLRRGSLMAALAHGGAIVTTQPITPVPELVDGVNVRLVPAGSALSLAEALGALLDAPDERAALGTGARRLAEHFAWARIGRQVLAFLTECAGVRV